MWRSDSWATWANGVKNVTEEMYGPVLGGGRSLMYLLRKEEGTKSTSAVIRRVRMVARFRRGKKIADRRIGLEARLRMPCNGSVLARWGGAESALARGIRCGERYWGR